MLKFNTNEKKFLETFKKDNIRKFIENFKPSQTFDKLNNCEFNYTRADFNNIIIDSTIFRDNAGDYTNYYCLGYNTYSITINYKIHLEEKDNFIKNTISLHDNLLFLKLAVLKGYNLIFTDDVKNYMMTYYKENSFCKICKNLEDIEYSYIVSKKFLNTSKYIKPESFFKNNEAELNLFIDTLKNKFDKVYILKLQDYGDKKWNNDYISDDTYSFDDLDESIQKNWIDIYLFDEDDLKSMRFVKVLTLADDDGCKVGGYFPEKFYESFNKCPWTNQFLPLEYENGNCNVYNGDLIIKKIVDSTTKWKNWYSLTFDIYNKEKNLHTTKYHQIPIYEDDIRSEIFLYYITKAFLTCKLFVIGHSVTFNKETLTFSSIHLKSIKDSNIYVYEWDKGHGYDYIADDSQPYYTSFRKTFKNFIQEAYSINVLEYGFVTNYIKNYGKSQIDLFLEELDEKKKLKFQTI